MNDIKIALILNFQMITHIYDTIIELLELRQTSKRHSLYTFLNLYRVRRGQSFMMLRLDSCDKH